MGSTLGSLTTTSHYNTTTTPRTSRQQQHHVRHGEETEPVRGWSGLQAGGRGEQGVQTLHSERHAGIPGQFSWMFHARHPSNEPSALRVHHRGVNVFAVSTAFEEFDLNTVEATEKLVQKGEIFGA